MRYMLNEANSEKVLLEKEIEYIKSYIALQNLRFSDTNYVHFNMAGDPNGIEVAPMIFIPFVENAFKHGISKVIGKKISYGTLYSYLDQLFRKGFISKSIGDPTPERGGRRKIFYKLTKKGIHALESAYKLQKLIWERLSEVSFD